MSTSGWVGLVLALVVSSVFVLLTFGRSFVLGSAPYWQTQVDDVTQYIAGFNMYFTAPWQFPLLAFDSLNYPDGTLVTFVDAIPLYALLLKVLLPATLAPFNPFGAWVALCFLLQGVGSWWIARELKTNSWAFLMALLVVFLTYPALMARLGHISLMSHWILLFAIALYIRSYRQSELPQWGWTLLLVGAFYINIYLFVMACGILLGALFSLRRDIGRRDIISFFSPFPLLVATAFLMFLPLPMAEVARESGFGYYSMNLLAPLAGGKLFALQVVEVPGQGEGFNYLGLGVLAALVVAYFLRKRPGADILRRHRPLFLLMLLYTFYAISNQIYFGGQKILVLSYPGILDGLTSQLRVSGRFFWPVGYSLIILSLLVLHRGLGQRSFAFAALLLVVLQLADLEDRYKVLRSSVLRDGPQPMDYAVWDAHLGEQAQTLYFYPKFKCGQNPLETLLPVMRYAAERGLKLNTGYIARYTPNCQDTEREIAASNYDQAAYIFVRSDYPNQETVMALFPESAGIHCAEIQFAHVCQTARQVGR